MNNVLKELLTELMSMGEATTKRKVKITPKPTTGDEAEGMPSGLYNRGGKYYDKPRGGTYYGRVEGEKFIPKETDPEIAGSKPAQAEPQTKSSQEPAVSEPSVPLSKYTSKEDSWSSNQVFGSIFSQSSSTITRGNQTIQVRTVLDPDTGENLDTSTPENRQRCLQIIDARLKQLEAPVKQAAKRLTQRGTDTQLQRIKKWMGNVGELYTLRELLATDTEAYLLPDSYPKNDIAVLVEDVERGLRITEISVKSSTGEKVGALGSNARVPLHSAVEGKEIEIDGKSYDAKNAIDASMFVYSQLMRFATEGHITGEQREIVIKPEKMSKFDKELATQSIGLSKEGSKGAQDVFVKARKLTQDDIKEFENSSLYAGLKKTPEHAELIDYYLNVIKQQIKENPDYRLSNTKELLTAQIAQILEKTDSPLVFESDLVSVRFSEQNGFDGISITPAEIMRQRASEKYGDIATMSVLDQMKKLGNWRLSTRGLNTHDSKTRAPKMGYFGAIINFAPPTDLLSPKDKLSPQNFVEYIKSQENE